jgi:hypothetical protein
LSGSDDRKIRWSKFFILHPSMSGAHSREHDRIYLVSVGIEWYFTIFSNTSVVSHRSFISISDDQGCVKSSPICNGLS